MMWLVHDGDFFASGCNGVLEGEFQQTAAALSRVHSRGHGDRVRVVVNLDVILMADVQALQIFAHDHQIDFVEPAARDHGARRTQVGVQLEFLPQAHIGGSITAARGVSSGPFKARRVRRMLSKVFAGSGSPRLSRLRARQSGCPIRTAPQRFERRERRVNDFGSDPVSGIRVAGISCGIGWVSRLKETSD